MVTVSKDGTWKFWDIDGELSVFIYRSEHMELITECSYKVLQPQSVTPFSPPVRYHLREDPRLLQSARVPEAGLSLAALSPDGRVAAISANTSLFLYSTSSGECMETLRYVHGGRC